MEFDTLMSQYRLPEISALPDLPSSEATKVLDHLFEPSEALHKSATPFLREKHFASYGDLIATIGDHLYNLGESTSFEDKQRLRCILVAHPRLGEKKISSSQSQKEQARLASQTNEDDDNLERMNKVYEERFPGLRYVVFVNGRDRAAILENMQARIDRNDIHAERTETIQAMCEIAQDRVRKLET